jgi:hypothetical protein
MAEEAYTTMAHCRNCDVVSSISIPKGTTVKEYFEKTVLCPNCGCSGLWVSAE